MQNGQPVLTALGQGDLQAYLSRRSTTAQAVSALRGASTLAYSAYPRGKLSIDLTQMYMALLHLDFFFLFGFWIQAVTAAPEHTVRYIYVIEIAALGLLPVQLISAAWSARRESKFGQ